GKMENYEPLEIIGTGSFGLIRKVRRKSDGKILARKEIDYRCMCDKEKQQLVSEVNIVRELKHPNIVRYYDRYVDNENYMIYIIMEYCEGGDLSSLIKKCRREGNYLPEDSIWFFFTQILSALHECHYGYGNSKSDSPQTKHTTILHRDIKPDNVFLDSNNNIKLGDFGLSRTLNPERELARTYVGTPFYMSPELITKSLYDVKSDIWALGCLLYELCALQRPFQAISPSELVSKVRKGKIPPLPSQYSEELNRVIKAMLDIDPVNRPNTTEFFKLERVRNCKEQMEMLKSNSDLKRREEELNSRIKQREEELSYKEATLHTREMLLASKEEELRNSFSGLQLQKEQFDAEIKRHAENLNVEIERQREELRIEFLELQRKREEINNGFLELEKKENAFNEKVLKKEEELKCSFLELQRQKEFNAILRERTQTKIFANSSYENSLKDSQHRTEAEIPPLKRTFSDVGIKTQKTIVFRQELSKSRPRKLIYRPLEPSRSFNQESVVSSQIPKKRLRTEEEIVVWDPNDDDAPSPFVKERRTTKVI
ncbi:10256_t:CDS:2, partial [Acaulospora morrowiae]